MFCETCGAEMPANARVCTQCRNDPTVKPTDDAETLYEVFVPRKQTSKSRRVAGILQIVFGVFGAGRLYLGHKRTALRQCLRVILTLGLTLIWFNMLIALAFGATLIWPFIDGVLILKGWVKTDAYGIPLRD